MTVLPVIELLESRVLLPDRLPPSRICHIPVDRVVQCLEPVPARLPTQFPRNARCVEGIAAIVTWPVLDMANERPGFAKPVEDGVHDDKVFALVIGSHVVGLSAGAAS